MVLEMLEKVKYAGICTDMRGVRHFWRKVPETERRGWKWLFAPQLATEVGHLLEFQLAEIDMSRESL
jgi:hypothetical protein